MKETHLWHRPHTVAGVNTVPQNNIDTGHMVGTGCSLDIGHTMWLNNPHWLGDWRYCFACLREVSRNWLKHSSEGKDESKLSNLSPL